MSSQYSVSKDTKFFFNEEKNIVFIYTLLDIYQDFAHYNINIIRRKQEYSNQNANFAAKLN